MRYTFLLLTVLVATASVIVVTVTQKMAWGSVPADSDLVVVVADSWTAQEGWLVHVPIDGDAPRKPTPPIRVWLGAAGLGWDRAQYRWRKRFAGPLKREGDNRT